MSDYKHTVHLPQTQFPMKANLADREPKLLAQWQTQNLYQQLRERNKNKPKFILHDGPPYANGNIHIGHAVNKILKDMINKSKTFDGFDAPYIPGWDCHGLPIELNVEKKMGKAKAAESQKQFREACRNYAKEFVKIQANEFERLGVLADWEKPYLTMTASYEANIVRALAKILKNGHIYQGRKPVHWCIDCGSALAEAEVEYHDKKSHALDVKFPVLDEEALFARCHHSIERGKGNLSMVIWTTTPWTLPANQGVAVHPELDYVIVQCENDQGFQRLVVADGLLKDVMFRYGIENYHVLAYCKGKDLEHLQVQHPFYQRHVPVVLGEHVTLESGTGLVHTAPGHGQDDYIVGTRYNLPIDNPVADNGCFVASTLLLAGLHINKANEEIIELLKAQNHLLHHEIITHSYPHCWRHKTPIIFRATHQWFVSMEKNGLRELAQQAIEQTEWLPDWGQARIATMVAKRPDWCISRQRIWGVPIPFLIHRETGQLHPDMVNILERIALQMDEQGIEAWYDLKLEELVGDEAKDYQKSTDILDVWFESGVSCESVLNQRQELYFPADLYLEGSDQHRGWFQSSLLAGTAMYQKPPFKTVLTHGFTVDAKGMKMSKSLGNVVAPEKVIKTLGADILRLWVATTDYRAEMSVSDEILNRTADMYRRIRNTVRYLLANLHDFDPEQHLVKANDLLQLDRFMLQKTIDLQQNVIAAYRQYEFHHIAQEIHHFCSIDLGSFYLDILKDRQYTCAKESVARRSAQSVMYHILNALVIWLAPILSFTAEEIWQFMPWRRDESVFLQEWYSLPSDFVFASEQVKKWQDIIALRTEVNRVLEKTRNEGKIGSGLEAEVVLYVESQWLQVLSELQAELKFIFITSNAILKPFAEKSVETEMSEVAGVAIEIIPLNFEKCERCWHRRADVNSDSQYPGLCQRCVTNITQATGEIRLFA